MNSFNLLFMVLWLIQTKIDRKISSHFYDNFNDLKQFLCFNKKFLTQFWKIKYFNNITFSLIHVQKELTVKNLFDNWETIL